MQPSPAEIAIRDELHCEFEMHGVRIAVESSDRGVLAALRRRFGTYEVGGDVPAHIALRYDGGHCEPPHGESREIYAVPPGTFRWFPAEQLLFSELGATRMRLAPLAGVGHFSSPGWSPSRRYLAVHTMTTVALMELMKARGRFALHVACLAVQDRAVIVAGPSGAGKSTIALALAQTGLDFLSDDLVLLERDPDDRIRALGVADALGITDQTLELLPQFERGSLPPIEPGFRKRLLSAEQAGAACVVPSAVPRVLVFPEIAAGSDSELEPLDPREAWRRLVPDVLITDSAATQAHLATIAALTEQVTPLRLRAGRDVAMAAALVRERL